MVRRMYGIYDIAAQALVNNMMQCLGTDDEAKRMFRAVVCAKGSIVNENPEDFGLVCVGVINYDDCSLTPVEFPLRPILTGDVVVREYERARNMDVGSSAGAEGAVAGSIPPR